jgi:hypothetical protein
MVWGAEKVPVVVGRLELLAAPLDAIDVPACQNEWERQFRTPVGRQAGETRRGRAEHGA